MCKKEAVEQMQNIASIASNPHIVMLFGGGVSLNSCFDKCFSTFSFPHRVQSVGACRLNAKRAGSLAPCGRGQNFKLSSAKLRNSGEGSNPKRRLAC